MFIIICLGLPAPLIAIHLLWVNLLTDSLPAIALGMDPKDPNIMLQKPRKANEGIFAHGGMKNTLLYGAILTIGVLIAYFSCARLPKHGAYTFDAIKDLYNSNPKILHQAQTMAFTTLAFSELFHMIGMSDINRSFIHIFKDRNKMMFIAFVAGIILQLFVIETPGVQQLFTTANLDWDEWLITLALSFIPLILHEIIVLIKFLNKKFKKI